MLLCGVCCQGAARVGCMLPPKGAEPWTAKGVDNTCCTATWLCVCMRKGKGGGGLRRGARLCAPGSGVHLLQCDGEPYWVAGGTLLLCCVVFVIWQPPTELCWQEAAQQHQSSWVCPFGHHLAWTWRQAWQLVPGAMQAGILHYHLTPSATTLFWATGAWHAVRLAAVDCACSHPWPAPCGMQQNVNSMCITPQLGAGPKPGVGRLQGPHAGTTQQATHVCVVWEHPAQSPSSRACLSRCWPHHCCRLLFTSCLHSGAALLAAAAGCRGEGGACCLGSPAASMPVGLVGRGRAAAANKQQQRLPHHSSWCPEGCGGLGSCCDDVPFLGSCGACAPALWLQLARTRPGDTLGLCCSTASLGRTESCSRVELSRRLVMCAPHRFSRVVLVLLLLLLLLPLHPCRAGHAPTRAALAAPGSCSCRAGLCRQMRVSWGVAAPTACTHSRPRAERRGWVRAWCLGTGRRGRRGVPAQTVAVSFHSTSR